MADVEIVGAKISPFVEKVVRAAEYKKIPFTHRDPTSFGEMAKLNPVTRKMPVAIFGDVMVYDSTFILREFEELAPDPPLLAADAQVAAAQRQLEDWSDEALYWYLMALRWAPENEARTVEQVAVYAPRAMRPFAAPIFRRVIARSTNAQGLGRLPYPVLVREVGERLDDLVLLLAQRSFFYASHPSVADFALFGQFKAGCSGPTPDFEQLVSERPTLADWMKRVEDAARG